MGKRWWETGFSAPVHVLSQFAFPSPSVSGYVSPFQGFPRFCTAFPRASPGLACLALSGLQISQYLENPNQGAPPTIGTEDEIA